MQVEPRVAHQSVFGGLGLVCGVVVQDQVDLLVGRVFLVELDRGTWTRWPVPCLHAADDVASGHTQGSGPGAGSRPPLSLYPSASVVRLRG